MQHCVTADISGNQVKSGQIVVFLVESGHIVSTSHINVTASHNIASIMIGIGGNNKWW